MSCWCSCCTCQGRCPPTLSRHHLSPWDSGFSSYGSWSWAEKDMSTKQCMKFLQQWRDCTSNACHPSIRKVQVLTWVAATIFSTFSTWSGRGTRPYLKKSICIHGWTVEHEHWWKYVPFRCKLSSGECLFFNFKLFLLSCNDLSRMEIASTVFKKRIV